MNKKIRDWLTKRLFNVAAQYREYGSYHKDVTINHHIYEMCKKNAEQIETFTIIFIRYKPTVEIIDLPPISHL